MKKKHSKKLLAILLAFVMLVTSIPAFALVSSASTTPSNNSAKYLMAYFTGNGNVTSSGKQQAIRFAVSDDGSNYTALNGNAPAILQTTGTHNARDPYIFRGHDGDYYLIATDADYSNGDWGKAQSTMTVWHSSDLTHWDSETHIDISQISGYTFSNYCWAPQVIWDDNVDEYMIYFATSDGSKQTIHYIYTTDLLDFSKYEVPKQLVDFNYNGTSYASIDADITYYNGKYIMFFKDESDYNASTNPGGKKLAFSVADKLGENAFTKAVFLNDITHNKALEGPQFNAMADGTYSLLADYFGDSGNFYKYDFSQSQLDNFISAYDAANNGDTLELSSLATFDTIINNIQPRHGSVVEITTPQYESLIKSFSDAVPAGSAVDEFSADSSNLVARYLVNDPTTDVKGGTSLTNNKVTWSENQYNGLGAASFDPGKTGKGSYLYAQTSVLDNVNATEGMTFSFLANADAKNISSVGQLGGRFFEFNNKGAANSAAWASTGNSCISVSNSGITEVMNNDYNGKTQVNPSILRNDAWHLYTISITSSEVCLYVDGTQVGKSALGVSLSETLTTLKAAKHFIIGGSFYNDDNTYAGQMRDFRVYNKAITETQAKNLSMQYELDTYDSATKGTEVYGNVTIDPIVYVHGTYGGGMKQVTDNAQFDYMMNGSIISTGRYDGECSTAVSVSGKTLTSVVATDTGKTLTITDGKLTGDLGGDYGSVNNYTDKSTVTLKFTFSDGTYEIHKLAVKPNPVATHTVSGAFMWHTKVFSGTYRNPIVYFTLANGSYGSQSAGSYTWSASDGNTNEVSKNFASMYNPYSTTWDTWESNKKVAVDSMTENAGTFDRVAGYCVTRFCNANGARTLTIDSPEANYYIDLSSSNNYGVTMNKNQYAIDIITTGMYYNATNSNEYQSNPGSASSTVVSGNSTLNSITSANPSQIKFNAEQSGTTTLTGTANVGTTKERLTQTYASTMHNSMQVTVTTNTNINLVVSDKTTQRNYYSTQIEDLKNGTLVASDYSAASWKAYTDALLELEYFLNDNTQTDAGSYQSNVFTARQNLEKLSNVNGYNEIKSFLENTDKIATDSTTGTPTLKEIVVNGDKYTQDSIDSVNTIITIANKILTDPQTDTSLYASVNKQLQNCKNFLMPKADETNLESAITAKEGEKIYNGNVQTAPLSSWLSLQTDVTLAKKTVTDTKNSPRYDTVLTQVTLNGVTYTFETPNAENSAEQNLIEATATELSAKNLEGTELDRSTIDAAFAMYNAVDTNKLNDTALALYNALYDQLYNGKVSSTVTDFKASLKNKVVFASAEDVAKYEKATKTTVPTDKILMNDVATSDNLIKEILTFLYNTDENDSAYVNKYSVFFIDYTGNSDSTVSGYNKYSYGQTVDLTSNYTGGDVYWKVELYKKGDVEKLMKDGDTSVTPYDTIYLSNYYGTTLQRTINSDVIVTVSTKPTTNAGYYVKVYNGYGTIHCEYSVANKSDIVTNGSSLTINSNKVTVTPYPFYEITSWSIQTDENEKTISLVPTYTGIQKRAVSATGGTISGNITLAKQNSTITLTASDSSAYAWAKKTTDGKYQIISYNPTCKTVVLKAEDYVVVTKKGNDYYAADGTQLTENNVAGFDSISGNISLGSYLDAKAPFAYIDITDKYTTKSNTPGIRYYVTVTTGCATQPKAYGVVGKKADSTNQFFPSGVINETGQFYYGIANSRGFDSVSAYVTSTVNYNGNSIDIRMISDYNN